jgi:dinuclear metal center YbgI/SA1388 family protein
MGVTLSQLASCIEKFSPSRLAISGDFVGVQVGPGDPVAQERVKIRKCAVVPYVTPQIILRAAHDGANALISYHGLFSDPINALTDSLLDKIRLLIENKITLYVVHTSWLSAECGVNDTLADILDLSVTEAFNVEKEGKTSPLGRICVFGRNLKSAHAHDVDVSLFDFIAGITQRLTMSETVYVGRLEAPVKKIVLCAGEFGRADLLRQAKSMGVDTFVTGNIFREIALLSNELGLSYVCVSQHSVVSLGMRRLMQLLSIDVPEVKFVFIESHPPWKRFQSTDVLTKRGFEMKTGD